MIPPCPRCGKDDFKKTRDETAHLQRKFKCKPKPVHLKTSRPRSPSPAPAPVVHTKGKDRRMEKLQMVTPTPVPKPESQMETPSEVERQDDQDRHARKLGEHMRTWGARLRRRWKEVTGEECDLPKNLKECQRLHHDLLQADDESFENNSESSEVERQDAQVEDLIFEE